MPADQLSGFLTGTTRQGSGKQKRLSRQAARSHLLPDVSGVDVRFAQPLDDIAIRFLSEKLRDAGGHFGPNFGYIGKGLLIGFLESLHRTKMPGQQLCRALAYEPNAERVNQTRKVVRLTRGN